jgi:hypothetical protein
MARYSEDAQQSVKQALHKKKRGKLKSGGSGKKVKSRKQAIAIGLSEARKKGAKVPPPPGNKRSKKKASKKTTARKKPFRKKGKKSVKSKVSGKRSKPARKKG